MVDQVLKIAEIKGNNNVLDNLNVIGNVGIGTTEPNAKLDVQGNIHAGNSDIYFTKIDHNHTGFGNTAGYAAIENAADYGALMILGRTGTPKGRYVRLWDYLQVNGSIDVTGNVGIGTANPNRPLAIRARDGNEELISFENPSGTTKWHINQNLGGVSGLNFVESGVADGRLFIKAGGNVGIGTTNPSAKLNVDPRGKGGIVIGNPSTGSGGFTSLIMEISAESDGYSSLQSIRKSGSLWGDISLNPYAGNIGIGTTTPKAKLDVQGDIRAGNSDIYFTKVDHNHTGIGNTAGFAAIENAADYGALMILGRAGTPKGRYVRLWDYLQINGSMDITGNVGIGTTAPQAGLHIDKAGTNNLALKLSSTGPGWGSGIQLQNKDINYGIYAGFGQFKICDANKGVDRLIIDAAGKIGIGTTTPKYTLDVNGTINASSDVVVGGGDCAEEFDIVDAESIEPGTVMVIDNNGALKASEQAYDKRVAGVISGAGDLRPGITLDKQANKANRLPLALNGKVYCKVDADCGPVEVGDLLTTSSTSGHAMKVGDHVKSIGAIIGKALRPLEAGCGLIPILVALQ